MQINFRDNFFKIKEWHIWFAWYPIKINTDNGYKIIWLEKVLRKASYIYCVPESGIENFIAYQYKPYNNKE
jgi:hypothetical protein